MKLRPIRLNTVLLDILRKKFKIFAPKIHTQNTYDSCIALLLKILCCPVPVIMVSKLKLVIPLTLADTERVRVADDGLLRLSHGNSKAQDEI